MLKPIYLIRIALQAVIIGAIYFLYCSNPDGSFTLRIGFVAVWLILSFISQIYLMRFRELYPRSVAKANANGHDVAEINFFLAVGLLVIYALIGPIVAVGFYFWDRQLN